MTELATTLALPRQATTRDWRMAAECRHADPDIFFPVSATEQSVQQVARAKAVCFGCGVRRECLQFALDTRADGVWGGMTEEERQRIAPRQVPSVVEPTWTPEQAARARSAEMAGGRKRGRADPYPVEKIDYACQLRGEGRSYGEISATTGIPKASLYRYLAWMRA